MLPTRAKYHVVDILLAVVVVVVIVVTERAKIEIKAWSSHQRETVMRGTYLPAAEKRV